MNKLKNDDRELYLNKKLRYNREIYLYKKLKIDAEKKELKNKQQEIKKEILQERIRLLNNRINQLNLIFFNNNFPEVYVEISSSLTRKNNICCDHRTIQFPTKMIPYVTDSWIDKFLLHSMIHISAGDTRRIREIGSNQESSHNNNLWINEVKRIVDKIDNYEPKKIFSVYVNKVIKKYTDENNDIKNHYALNIPKDCIINDFETHETINQKKLNFITRHEITIFPFKDEDIINEKNMKEQENMLNRIKIEQVFLDLIESKHKRIFSKIKKDMQKILKGF
jgi:hypothetical protein